VLWGPSVKEPKCSEDMGSHGRRCLTKGQEVKEKKCYEDKRRSGRHGRPPSRSRNALMTLSGAMVVPEVKEQKCSEDECGRPGRATAWGLTPRRQQRSRPLKIGLAKGRWCIRSLAIECLIAGAINHRERGKCRSVPARANTVMSCHLGAMEQAVGVY